MSLLLKNVLAIDGQVGLHEVCDIRIEDGMIAEVGRDLPAEGCDVRDLEGCVTTPGFVDIHVHLREPGYEYKEDIESGTRAAAHGGMVAVCSMPNTDPVTDSASVIEFILRRAREAGHCRVLPSGACTKGLKGEILAEMGDMALHGAVAFTDDGRGVQDAAMMRRVMEYASQFGCPVMSHCQDEALVGTGQINEGPVSTLLGLTGWPAQGEEIQIARDIELCRLTGCQYHVQHVTTARGMELIRQAKVDGLPVTCEVTPHHLFLDETCIDDSYNTFLKVNPPLRSAADAQALLDAVFGGRGSVENGIYPHGLYGFNPKLPEIPYDPEQAKALLKEAGYPDGLDLTIGVKSSSPESEMTQVRLAVSMWEEIGVRTTIQVMDESEFMDLRKGGKLPCYTATWTADYDDPDNFIYTFFGNSANTAFRSLCYPDEAIMGRVRQARTIPDADARLKEYRDLERIIVQEDAA